MGLDVSPDVGVIGWTPIWTPGPLPRSVEIPKVLAGRNKGPLAQSAEQGTHNPLAPVFGPLSQPRSASRISADTGLLVLPMADLLIGLRRALTRRRAASLGAQVGAQGCLGRGLESG